MNEPQEIEPGAGPTSADAEAVKPAPRRRARRKSEDAAATESQPPVEAAVEAAAVAPADSGESAPKRPRRSPRRKSEAAESAPEVSAAESADSVRAADAESTEPVAAALPAPVVQAAFAGGVGVCFSDVISGEFDEVGEVSDAAAEAAAPEVVDEASAEPAADEESADPGKRILDPDVDAPKLQKVLAQAGIGSRRDMEALIQDGQVTVNGEKAHLGMRITWGDQIRVAGRKVQVRIQPPVPRVLAYHKPVGEVVTHNDPEGRPTVFRRLPRMMSAKWLSVGRLDLNTEGLLLFTNSGDLANRLMHPRFGVEREYAVRVLGTLEEDARAKLLAGVEIDGQTAAFTSIEGGGGEGVNRWYQVVIHEGRNREVRKLFAAVGLTVNRLIRIRYGSVVLPRGLKRGVWVELGEADVRQIVHLAGGERQQQGGRGGDNAQQGRGGRGQQQERREQQGRGGRQGGGGGQGNNAGARQQQPGQGRGTGGGQPSQRGGRPQGGAEAQAPQRRDDRRNKPREERRDVGEDFEDGDPLHIPNPLEQTFDRRFASGSKRIASGFGRPSDESAQRDAGGKGRGGKGQGPKQPDPMQTSVGYIGADAYFTRPGGGNRRGGRR
jgi:23S rRNA pseudouridine2605 synthase